MESSPGKRDILTIFTGDDTLLFMRDIRPLTRSLKKRKIGDTIIAVVIYIIKIS